MLEKSLQMLNLHSLCKSLKHLSIVDMINDLSGL